MMVGAFGATVAFAPAASAWCDPNPNVIVRVEGGVVKGAEDLRANDTAPTTCDEDDGIYQGRVYEGAPNGSCTTIQYFYNNRWNSHHTNCADFTWSNYSAFGSGFWIRLCVSSTVCSPQFWHHGF